LAPSLVLCALSCTLCRLQRGIPCSSRSLCLSQKLARTRAKRGKKAN
jgi:hypothetical protein